MAWTCLSKATTLKSLRTSTIKTSKSSLYTANYRFSLLLYCLLLMVLMISPIRTSNNACDWTGSGLSTSYANREIVSIYLRCTAGKIIWNYPKGAIRVLLRSPIGLHRNFRACLKIHRTKNTTPSSQKFVHKKQNKNSRLSSSSNDLKHSNRIARIFLEGPKRLITIYDDVDHQIVKCFRSINEQVALYVEADEMPFENLQTIFEYNLEFINNKHHSIRPPVTITNINDSADKTIRKQSSNYRNDHRFNKHHNVQSSKNHVAIEIDDNEIDGKNKNNRKNIWWWLWRHWQWGATNTINTQQLIESNHQPVIDRNNSHRNFEEDILDGLGESWEICRPCTDIEMANAYCSGDIVTRGTIYSIQERPTLETIEIGVKHTKILRNNMLAISDAEDLWRHYYKTYQPNSPASTTLAAITNDFNHKIRHNHNRNDDDHFIDDELPNLVEFKFHTPAHCLATHGAGEFVFMGRRRFEEIMLICAPRLDEWVLIARQLNDTNNAPCILHS